MNYQQYFVVVALVIPVFFLAHVLEFRRLRMVTESKWLLLLYGGGVLGLSAFGEAESLGFVWETGTPRYATDRMPWPDDFLNAWKLVLMVVIVVLLFATVVAPLVGAGEAEPAGDEDEDAPLSVPATGGSSAPRSDQVPANGVEPAVVLAVVAAYAAFMVGSRRRRKNPS